MDYMFGVAVKVAVVNVSMQPANHTASRASSWLMIRNSYSSKLSSSNMQKEGKTGGGDSGIARMAKVGGGKSGRVSRKTSRRAVC
ncbi:hypothetical protein CAEBREN_30833 [Caenorhabditis brenneri]|uniref:Uncharacterized protein n=1 Tax=Caenorhabditis brenneri TaxID=135651 RepID=G0M6Y6_CAEBE|nr:hypothetical protein CAEBREN_30833 [Caenorhabditis brenneri]